MTRTHNVRIREFEKLISPLEIQQKDPLPSMAEEIILNGRSHFCNIMRRKDPRFLVISGPCSIHDPQSALEYAKKLKQLSLKYEDKIFTMMRVYFEKPRSTVGWKGLIYDPDLDGSNKMQKGLTMARRLLIQINEIGIPIATELLDPITATYISELVSWAAIGARTTESQTHRQMVSGLSVPVGFKNNTDGNLKVAIDAMAASKYPHSFLGIDDDGQISIIHTKGNPDTHIVLRGGASKPNYHMEDIEDCETLLKKHNLDPAILIDCSHQNSKKDCNRQFLVVRDIMAQKKFGNQSIFGLMLESHLLQGKQTFQSTESLNYGVSLTDACIGWQETETIFEYIYQNIKNTE